jgi:hypothetical protein
MPPAYWGEIIESMNVLSRSVNRKVSGEDDETFIDLLVIPISL